MQPTNRSEWYRIEAEEEEAGGTTVAPRQLIVLQESLLQVDKKFKFHSSFVFVCVCVPLFF